MRADTALSTRLKPLRNKSSLDYHHNWLKAKLTVQHGADHQKIMDQICEWRMKSGSNSIQ